MTGGESRRRGPCDRAPASDAPACKGDDGNADTERVYVAECFMCDAMAGPFNDPDSVDRWHDRHAAECPHAGT